MQSDSSSKLHYEVVSHLNQSTELLNKIPESTIGICQENLSLRE